MSDTREQSMSDDDQQLLGAVRDLAHALASDLTRLRRGVLAKYKLGEARTNIALSCALLANFMCTSRLAVGQSLDDLAELDEAIMQAIRENSSTLSAIKEIEKEINDGP